MLHPHYEIPLAVDASEALPIQEIIVGPTANPDLAALGIEVLLVKTNVRSIATHQSNVPYRRL